MFHSSFHDEVWVVPYREEWVQRFQAMKARIIEILLKVNIVCDIRHVGGTAVPGMCSKPIVDMLVTVDREDLEKAVRTMADEIRCLGECGRPGRYFFSEGDTEHDAVYIHLTTSGNQVTIDHMAFRDILLSCPDIRKQYAELKMQLAEQYPDNRAMYRLKKGVFIEKWLEEGYEVQGNDNWG